VPLPAAPKDDLPVLPAPTQGGWAPRPASGVSEANRPRRVRYAIAFAATKTYLDGRTCEYSTDLGRWGPWIERRPNECPIVEVPATNDPRVNKRYVVRQFEGERSRYDRIGLHAEGFDTGSVSGTNQAYNFIDANV
jgi:hypothetical protein